MADSDEKAREADWKKTVKQLKSKDAATKLAGIARCDVESLTKGDCLGPLLALCSVSKKNKADVAGKALEAVRQFLSDDDDRPRLIFEVGDKKGKKLPAVGKLLTDVFDTEDLVKDALFIFRRLIEVPEKKKSWTAQFRSSIAALASVISTGGDDDLLADALVGLEYLDRQEPFVPTGATTALTLLATAEGPNQARALRLLDAIAADEAAECGRAILQDTTGVSALVHAVSSSASSREDLERTLRILEHVLTAAVGREEEEPLLRSEGAKALAGALERAVTEDDDADPLVAVASRCVERHVDAFGRAGYEDLASLRIPSVLLTLMTARDTVEATLEVLATRYDVVLAFSEEAPLSAREVVESLKTTDDARLRAMRFAEGLATRDLRNAKALGSAGAAEPLLTVIQEATDDNAAGHACRLLRRLVSTSPEARLFARSDESLAILDAAFQVSAVATMRDDTVAVRAAAAEVLAVLATSSDEDPAVVTETTAATALAIFDGDERDDVVEATMDLVAAIAGTSNGRTALLRAAAATWPSDDDDDDEATEAEELFEAPLAAVDPPNKRWWPYVRVLAYPGRVLADPGAALKRLELAIAVIGKLAGDPSALPSDHDLDVDCFASATLAMGILVALGALASVEADETLAIQAAEVARDLAERAEHRVHRLEARAAAAGALAAEESRLASHRARHDDDDDETKDDAKKKKAPVQQQKKKASATEIVSPEVAELLKEAEAAVEAARDADDFYKALAAGEAARDAARIDERGGPTREQWYELLTLRADDKRRGHSKSTPLLAALVGGASELALQFVNAGADVNVKDADGVSPLCRALQRGEFAQMLLDHGADPNAADNSGAPALQYAMVSGENYVEALLKAGADADVADGRGKFPLHWAIEKSAEDMVRLLLTHCSVDRCDKDGQTPLHAALRCGKADLAALLLEAGARPNVADVRGRLPLHMACARLGNDGMPAMVATLLDVRYPRDVAVYGNERAGKSPAEKRRLTVAAILDTAFTNAVDPPVIVDRLCTASELLAAEDDQGRTPLHLAAGCPLDDDDDDDSRDDDDVRSAALAVLLKRDDVSSTPCAAENGASLVHLVVRRLGDAALAPLDAAIANGALLDAVVELPDEVLTYDLVPLAEDDAQVHPLGGPPAPAPGPAPASAPGKGLLEAVPPSVVGPAPAPVIEVAPTRGRVFTALHFAVKKGASRAVRWLLDHGASRTPRFCEPTPLSLAALVGANQGVVEALGCDDSGDLASDLGGLSPLHVAALYGFTETLTAFLAATSEVDVCDVNGRTPLLVATLRHQAPAMRLLLGAGADPSIPDCSGISAIDAAIDLRAPSLIAVLLEAAQIAPVHVLRAEQRHIDAAVAAFLVPRQCRDASPAADALARSTAVLTQLQQASTPVAQHHHPCFEDGILFSDVLAAEELADMQRREQNAAALRIQTKARQRAAVTRCADKKKSNKKASGGGGTKKKRKKSHKK